MTKRFAAPPPAAKGAPDPTDRPPASPQAPGRSGRVNFDERGHAVWEWAVRTGMFDRNASTQRVRALTEAPVKLELEQTLGALPRKGSTPAKAPAAAAASKPRSFNPYDTGAMRKR